MGNSLNLIIDKNLEFEISENDGLFVGLAERIGTREEDEFLKKILTFYVQNHCGLNSKNIEQWWEKREKLFSNVDDLLWSHPLMLDDVLNRFEDGIEERKTLTMTSNMRIRILKYLEKLRCVIDDEFSLLGRFNWEEYIGVRLQCYIDLIFILKRYRNNISNFVNNIEDVEMGNSSLFDSLICTEKEGKRRILNIFEKNSGNMKVYEKIMEKSIFLPETELFIESKTNVISVDIHYNKYNDGISPRTKIKSVNIPKSLEEIYLKKENLNQETLPLIEMLLGYIWIYYKNVLLSNGYIVKEDLNRMTYNSKKEINDQMIDRNTMICINQIIQKILFNSIFEVINNKSQHCFQLLEVLISSILQLSINILSTIGNEFIHENNSNDMKDTRLRSIKQKPNIKGFETVIKILFSETDIFFGIVRTSLIIVNILSSEINPKFDILDFNDMESIQSAQELNLVDKENIIRNNLFLQDVHSISLIMRIINKCINLTQQLKSIKFWISNNDENEWKENSTNNLGREELYSYGPFQFNSAPKNNFMLEFQEQYKLIGVDTETPNNEVPKMNLYQNSDRIKYFWKLIKIPNASHILFIFADKCSTEKNKDILEVFGLKKNRYYDINSNNNLKYLRTYYNESICGELSGDSSKWPKKPIVYEGNSLLIVFRISTKIENRSTFNEQWGFRIYFQSHFWNQIIDKKDILTQQKGDTNCIQFDEEIYLYNFNDLFSFSTAAVASSISIMLRGPAVSQIEKSYVDILHSLLFIGGLSVEENDDEVENISETIPFLWKDQDAFCGANDELNKSFDLKTNLKSGTSVSNFGVNEIYRYGNEREFVLDETLYYTTPRIDEIEHQIIQNVYWGKIINFILECSSVVHYNLKKNHSIASIDLINDRKFLSIINHELRTGRIGTEEVSITIRGYICCYLHHLGLYYNIFQLCERLLKDNMNIINIINQVHKEKPDGSKILFNKNNEILKFIITFILNTDFCEPLLYVWTLGRQFRSWITVEKQKAQILAQENSEKKGYEEACKNKSNYEYWCKILNCKIQQVLSIVPFSGNSHPTINSDISYESFENENSIPIVKEQQKNNYFDINGSKYIYYPNENICLVLSSMINICNLNNNYFNKNKTETFEEIGYCEKNASLVMENKINNSYLFTDDYECDELEILDINHIIKSICDGINDFMKIEPTDYLNKKINELDNINDSDLSGMNFVLKIRRFRAIIRFEAYRIMSYLVNDECENCLLQLLLIKSVRSLGNETPCQLPTNFVNYVYDNDQENWIPCKPKYCLFFLHEHFSTKRDKFISEVHYTDNLRGCGKKIQLQVKTAYYKLIDKLINNSEMFSIETQIIRMSVIAFHIIKEADLVIILKSNIPAKLLKLLTNCENECETEKNCIPTIFPGAYPIFLIYSIMSIKSSIWDNSALRLSFIFSSFVGLSHSMNISGLFKGQLTSRELWKMCEIYFMGNILILSSRIECTFEDLSISRREQRMYLEYMKYIFNRRNNFKFSMKSFHGFDRLFIKTFLLQQSSLSNILCHAFDSDNQVTKQYSIKLLWKFLPLIPVKDFLKLYSKKLLTHENLSKKQADYYMNYRKFFDDCLEQIGRSFTLFNNLDSNESINAFSPVILIDSSESGVLPLFKKQQGIKLNKENRILDNKENYHKNLVILLRYIVLYACKEFKRQKMEKIQFLNEQESIYNGLIDIICQNINKIPELLGSLLNKSDNVFSEEIYKCIGSLVIVIDEYEDEISVGNIVFYQEFQLNNVNSTQNCKEGILISSNPATNQLNILISEKDKSLELKTFSYENLKISTRYQTPFPIEFFLYKMKMDIVLSLIKIANIANDYLKFLSPSISSSENITLNNKVDSYSTIISDQDKKKLIGLQFLSMSVGLICMLLKNNYISNLIDEKDKNLEILKELHRLMINIGMIEIPTINEQIEDSNYLNMLILHRRFIQRALDTDKFCSTKYYPIFKKSTQTDLLFNSPYARSTVKLPTEWELGRKCSYYFNERVIICNFLSQSLDPEILTFITTNNCIPTTLCYYYFECKFTNIRSLIKLEPGKDDLNDLINNEDSLEFSIGLYREGCLRGSAGAFGSFAYKNTGKLLHSCTEEELIKTNVEKFTYGDTIGCGIDFIHNLIFFTKNGKLITTELNNKIKEFEFSDQLKYQDALFENVKGQFRPAVWIENSGLQQEFNDFITNLLIEGNFGQEKFDYNYINKLNINNILSLLDEDESIFQEPLKSDTISKSGSDNLNYAMNKTEFNRRTIAGELNEIMGGELFPMSLCILALERCEDNLELAINWLLENGIQELDDMQSNFIKEISEDNVDYSQFSQDIIEKDISLTEDIENEQFLDKLVDLRSQINDLNKSEYLALINTNIYASWNIKDPRMFIKSNINDHLDISRYLLSFGPLGEFTWNGVENNFMRNTNFSNNNGITYSNDIWFCSSGNFQNNGTISQRRRIENIILSSNTQRRVDSSIISYISDSNNINQKSYFPGTIVKIASNIKYWISFVKREPYFELINASNRNIGNIIDIHHLPKFKMVYFLRRLSKLTGIVWSCNQVSSSTLVQFIDYNSLVYYFVDLPTYFLVEMKTNLKNTNTSKLSSFYKKNSTSFQQYIRDAFLSGSQNETGKTNLNEYLTYLITFYPQLEYFKCIITVRNAISEIINQVPICICDKNEYSSDQAFMDTLRLFKLVFGNKGPKLCDYSLSNSYIMEEEELNHIFHDEENKETNIQGFIETLEKISKVTIKSSIDLIFEEYISHIRNCISYKLPIVSVESAHPYECNIDKRIDISIRNCEYIYAIFDPLCEIQLDTLSSLTINVKNKSNGEEVTILKKNGKGLSGYKQLIPLNSFSVRFTASAQNSNKYGIKAIFIPIKYSLNDENILKNNNIHFSYILLDLLCRSLKISKNNIFPKIKEVVQMLLIILYNIHIPKNIKYNIQNYSESVFNSLVPIQGNILPLQNIFIHIIQQLIYIFKKMPNILLIISEKSSTILEYLDNLSNIIYSLQMDQLQLVTNNGQNVDIKFSLLMQLHYLLFFYSNNKNLFSLSKMDNSEINKMISSNLFNSLTSLDLQIQLNLINELNLSVYDSLIKMNFIQNTNKLPIIIPMDESNFLKNKQTHSVIISNFLLNGDFRSHQFLMNNNRSIYNICPWFHIISTSNIPKQAFKSSLLNIYAEICDFSNGNSFIELFHELVDQKININFPDWSINNQYLSINEPTTPLIIIEKMSEIQIDISSAKIIFPDNQVNLNNYIDNSIDITDFIKEKVEMMSKKLLLLPKNRISWIKDPILKSCFTLYSGDAQKLLNQPIIINYSLLRVLTNEVIVSKSINFAPNDLVIITTSPYYNAQDRMKLLWDLLSHIENSSNLKLEHKYLGRPWVNNWEREMIFFFQKEKGFFDPRNCTEYLDTFSFNLFGENEINIPTNHLCEKIEENNNSSWEKTSTIQLMKDFLLKTYSSSIFEKQYWPVFIGTIPICDVEFYNNSNESFVENKFMESCRNIELPSQVSTLREVNAPCSVSFWLYPLDSNTWNQVFFISNNKKFEKLSYNVNIDNKYSSSNDQIETQCIIQESNDSNWKLITYRGITVSTISFWITETGSLGVIINSPNKNYSANLLMVNQTIPQHTRDAGIASFSSFIQNNSSIIEYHTTKMVSNRKIYQNQWNHIALTIGSPPNFQISSNQKDDDDFYTVKLYINGLLDESKNIPIGNLPLLNGDLPWIIGWPKYMRDLIDSGSVELSQNNNLNQNKSSNIFLGQDIASSKLLECSRANNKYFRLTNGEPLFGLIANLIVVYSEWSLQEVHDYIKETYDEILYQDEIDELNASANLSEYSNNSNVYSDTSILTPVTKDNYYYSSSCKSVVHVFSSNWKNKPIVTYFNNIWQSKTRDFIKKISDQRNEIKINQRKFENFNIREPIVVSNRQKFRVETKRKVLGVSTPIKLNIFGHKELNKFNHTNQDYNAKSGNCSCSEYPIDMSIIIRTENDEEKPFVILRLKYLDKLLNKLTLSNFVKVLDTFFEQDWNSKKMYFETNSNNFNINNSQIVIDKFSSKDILKKFHDHGEIELSTNNENTENIPNFRDEFTEDSISNKMFVDPEFTNEMTRDNFPEPEKSKIILPYIKEFMEYLFLEVKNQDFLFAVSINAEQSNSYSSKIGCENCKNAVLNYCGVCYSIIKRLSSLFVSILNFVDIISPRSSLFKYIWLRRLKKYINSSLKDIILNLCLALTEDSTADGRIRVLINRPRSILYSRENQDIYDPYGLNSVFGQVFKNLENVPINKMRTRNRPWYVIYEGEGGIDAGGIYRDSISHICFELQSDRLPLFILCPNSYGFGENQYYFIPNPNLAKHIYIYNYFTGNEIEVNDNINFHKNFEIEYINPDKIKCSESIYDSLYKFVGRLMGISIRTHLTLNLDFPTIVWKLILNEKININDIKQVDGYSIKLYEKLIHIKNNWKKFKKLEFGDEKLNSLLEDFNSLDLTWSLTNSNGKLVELRKNGKYLPVKINELELYCNLFIKYKINYEFTHATKNLRQGIIDIIPEQVLELFTPNELEKLICGVPSIDINLLKLHTKYTGYSSDEEIIKWFWDVLSNFTIIQQQMFLRFVWGRCRLPNGNSNWESNMEIVRVYPGRGSIGSNEELSSEENNQIYEMITLETMERANNNLIEIHLEESFVISNSTEVMESITNNERISDIIQHENNERLETLYEFEIRENVPNNSTKYIRKEDLMLPTSHTCFFQLELPKYSSQDILREKLLYAITEGIAIDTDNRATDINWEQV